MRVYMDHNKEGGGGGYIGLFKDGSKKLQTFARKNVDRLYQDALGVYSHPVSGTSSFREESELVSPQQHVTLL